MIVIVIVPVLTATLSLVVKLSQFPPPAKLIASSCPATSPAHGYEFSSISKLYEKLPVTTLDIVEPLVKIGEVISHWLAISKYQLLLLCGTKLSYRVCKAGDKCTSPSESRSKLL